MTDIEVNPISAGQSPHLLSVENLARQMWEAENPSPTYHGKVAWDAVDAGLQNQFRRYAEIALGFMRENTPANLDGCRVSRIRIALKNLEAKGDEASARILSEAEQLIYDLTSVSASKAAEVDPWVIIEKLRIQHRDEIHNVWMPLVAELRVSGPIQGNAEVVTISDKEVVLYNQAEAQCEPSSEKFTMEELNRLFADGIPYTLMKLIFPEKSQSLTTGEIRQIARALASVSQPQDIRHIGASSIVPQSSLQSITPTPVVNVQGKFKLRDHVYKSKGPSWVGHVVGFYSTELTPVGYAVESSQERGSVQIYPEAELQYVGVATTLEGSKNG